MNKSALCLTLCAAIAHSLYSQVAPSIDDMVKPVQSLVEKYQAELSTLKAKIISFRSTLKPSDPKFVAYTATEKLIDDELHSLIDGAVVDFKSRPGIPLQVTNDLVSRRAAYERDLKAAKTKVFAAQPSMTADQKAEVMKAIDSIVGKVTGPAVESGLSDRATTEWIFRRADGNRVVRFVSNHTSKNNDLASAMKEAEGLGAELFVPRDARDVRELFQEIDRAKLLPSNRVWIGLLYDHARNVFTDRNGTELPESNKMIKDYSPLITLGLKANNLDKSRKDVVVARRSDGSLELFLTSPGYSGSMMVGYIAASIKQGK